MFKVVENRKVNPNTHEMIVEAPEIASRAQAGQFALLMVNEHSERIPYTLADWDEEAGTVNFIVLEVGKSTGDFVHLQPGDDVAHVVGPLGMPLEVENFGTVACIGGCYGLGGIVPVGRTMQQAGNRVVTYIEARMEGMHYYLEKYNSFSDEVVQTTTDGSNGVKGHGADILAARLEEGMQVDRVFTVGCPFMMMISAEVTRPYGIKTFAALNPIMLDGTGMCGACRCTVGEETKFACVDGPFFDAHEVDWHELRDRRAAYIFTEREVCK